MSHGRHRQRFERTWGKLAKAVLESAFEDLDPQGEDKHVNKVTMRASARRFFESRRFRPWADAAGFGWHDCEQAYLDIIGKGEQG